MDARHERRKGMRKKIPSQVYSTPCEKPRVFKCSRGHRWQFQWTDQIMPWTFVFGGTLKTEPLCSFYLKVIVDRWVDNGEIGKVEEVKE